MRQTRDTFYSHDPYFTSLMVFEMIKESGQSGNDVCQSCLFAGTGTARHEVEEVTQTKLISRMVLDQLGYQSWILIEGAYVQTGNETQYP